MITVVAYKPESSDYCRGCLMDSYYSDFGLKTFNDMDGAVEFVAFVLLKNEQLRINEKGYEIHIFSSVLDDEEWSDELNDFVYGPEDIILHRAKKITEQQVIDYKREQEVRQNEKRAAKQLEKEKKERKQLAVLQEKYSNKVK